MLVFLFSFLLCLGTVAIQKEDYISGSIMVVLGLVLAFVSWKKHGWLHN